MSKWRIRAALALSLLVAIGLAGCGSRVTKSNYDRITPGMTISEVESILGKGVVKTNVSGGINDLTGSVRLLEWTDDQDRTISITFIDDKVKLKTETGL